jgi:hypothetical protein
VGGVALAPAPLVAFFFLCSLLHCIPFSLLLLHCNTSTRDAKNLSTPTRLVAGVFKN